MAIVDGQQVLRQILANQPPAALGSAELRRLRDIANALAPVFADQRAIGLERIGPNADLREFRRRAALEDVAADKDGENRGPGRNLARDNDRAHALAMQAPRAGDKRIEEAWIAPVGLVVILGEVAANDEHVRLDRPDRIEHIVVDRAAAGRARHALIHGDVFDQGYAKNRGEREEIGLGAVDRLQSGEQMGGVRVPDNENGRLSRICDRCAMMSLEEARRPFALLVERIGRLIALVEAAQQRLALSAIGVKVEDAVHQRRKPGRKALRVVGHPSHDSG